MKKSLLIKSFNLIGIILMVLSILIAVPLTVPKIMGIHIYEVLSGSMEPVYPVGSAIYVKPCDVSDVQVGDAITFHLLGDTETVMTHRVVSIDKEKKVFITKGDANLIEDKDPTSFDRLIGKPFFCIPKMAILSDYLNTGFGKSMCFILFSIVLILWIVADSLNRGLIGGKDKQNVQNIAKSGKVRKNILQYSGAFCIIFALCGLGFYFFQYKVGEVEYDNLLQYVSQSTTEKQNSEIEKKNPENIWENQDFTVDFEDLEKQNPDIAAWLVFDNPDISYPVMYSGDNQYYLTHTFSRNENSSAAIFIEAANKKDFNEYNTIIYGHNMKNGSMFGSLKKYKDYEFYLENPYFTLCTPDANYCYQIFACDYVNVGDEVYTINFNADETYQKYLDDMKNNSLYDTGVTAINTDKIITLSTCTYSDEKRFIVQAKCILVKYK